MIGHGRPALFVSALARAAIVVCASLSTVSSAADTNFADRTVLRITWGGGESTQWLGRIAVDDGSLSDLAVLGRDVDAAGSVWLEDGQVRIAALSAHKHDSIEIVVQSSPTANLQIELTPKNKSAESTASSRIEVPLAEVFRRPYQARLDDFGNMLEVQIAPASSLRISPNHEALIFAPGEQCSFEISPALANIAPGTRLDIQTSLVSARRPNALWSDTQQLEVPLDGPAKVLVNVPLPRVEGAYTVHVAVAQPSGYQRIWAGATRLAERRFDVVVLEPQPAAPKSAARWESVLEIDPTNPRWIERLPSWTQLQRIPGLNRTALGSTRANLANPAMGPFIELAATPRRAGPHWQAYSLPLKDVGVPHMLELDCSGQVEQYLGISIVEPDSNGVLSGIHRDSGVYIDGFGRSEAAQKQTHRLVFWPRTQAPLLVVTNLHPDARALFGQIRVFKRTGNQLNAGSLSSAGNERLIAAYFARPMLAETFGSARALQAASQPVDDGATAYENAARLADYLRYAGYNSAIINVALVGRPADSTRKSLDIDSTELILRVFDREGLALLPAIDFAAPMPQLESLRRSSDPQTSGLEWIGPNGRTWLEVNGNRHGLAPYYNLLDPRVQQAVLQNVRDLIARYGPHRAFAGLAVQLSSDGYAQLPPLDWGLDDATIGRFARDNGIQFRDTGPDRFAARHALVTGQHAAAWRDWRNAQVSTFYTRLASIVRANGDRRLVLTTENVFAHPQRAAAMRPNLLPEPPETRLASALADTGLDRRALEQIPGVVLCPTRYVEPMVPLPDRAVDFELNDAYARWYSSPSPTPTRGALLYHRPTRHRLASFEVARTPWRTQGEMRLVCQPLPHGSSVRQPYVQAMVENDPAIVVDGGELLPIGQEDVLREVRTIIAQLPTTAEVTELSTQPVVVRTYAEPKRATIVVMNLSPWHCDAQVVLDVPQAATLEPVVADSATDSAAVKSVALTAGRQSWPVSLAPYEIRAARAAVQTARVVDVEVNLGQTAIAELTGALSMLSQRDLTASCSYDALPNPSFEPTAAAGRVPGWHLIGANAGATAELDATDPQDGKTCLYLHSTGQAATVESEAFPVPATGQLAMTIYVRGQNLGPTTELRLAFEADREGQKYRQSARLRVGEIQRPASEWGRPFVVFLDNLPLDSSAQMRVAFELTGPGEVWLDNARLYDLLFPLKFYGNAQQELLQLNKHIYAAKSAYDTRHISDFVRIFDSYWPRFILAYRPPVPPRIAEGPQPQAPPALPPQPNEGQEPAPGIGERIKRLVPILR